MFILKNNNEKNITGKQLKELMIFVLANLAWIG